jgi:Tol biopolymer transport system component
VWAEELPSAPAAVVQWSPDGSTVAVLGAADQASLTNFDQFGLPFVDIELIRSDGSTQFVTEEGAIGSFGWNREGDSFAAVVHATDERSDLVTISPDGTQTLVARDAITTIPPAWSPDGKSIIFARASVGTARDGSEGEVNLWIASSSGGDPYQLTDDGAIKLAVSWTAGGSRLLYSRASVDGCEVYSIAVDGTDRQGIANRDALGGCAVSLSQLEGS